MQNCFLQPLSFQVSLPMRYIPVVLFIFMLSILNATSAFSQKIKYKADGLLENGTKDGRKYRKLIENVVFTQKDTRVRCDVSYMYRKENIMEAFDNVHVKDGDSVTITSDKLIFEGNKRMAKLRENVIYTSGNRRLYTDNLDYNLESKVGRYHGDGKLVDEQNTLTSKSGTYFNSTSYAIFYGKVVLVSPKYTLKADTLEYDLKTKIAYTKGNTKIITGDNTTVDADGGEFRTSIEQTLFVDGRIETPDYYLEGDDIFLDDDQKKYKVNGNVLLRAKSKDVILIGDEATYDKASGISKIYSNAVMKKIMEKDTFFLSADTLVSIESEIASEKMILAYYNVKMFREDMQGKSDSMTYILIDSTILFSDDPVMWSDNNQIIADTIDLVLKNNALDHMNIRRNSFIVSNDTSISAYNQIKGRNMVGYFIDRKLDKVNVNGNGESLYFAKAENASVMMGMNKIFCSNMLINFSNNKPVQITFYKDPEASFIPPHELLETDTQLEGFSWRASERPTLGDVVYYYQSNIPPQEDVISAEEEELSSEGLSDQKILDRDQ